VKPGQYSFKEAIHICTIFKLFYFIQMSESVVSNTYYWALKTTVRSSSPRPMASPMSSPRNIAAKQVPTQTIWRTTTSHQLQKSEKCHLTVHLKVIC